MGMAAGKRITLAGHPFLEVWVTGEMKTLEQRPTVRIDSVPEVPLFERREKGVEVGLDALGIQAELGGTEYRVGCLELALDHMQCLLESTSRALAVALRPEKCDEPV